MDYLEGIRAGLVLCVWATALSGVVFILTRDREAAKWLWFLPWGGMGLFVIGFSALSFATDLILTVGK